MNATAPLVLVVDDAATVRAYHRDVLEHAGFGVMEAANGVAALESALAAPSPPALMLVDLNMPQLDGFAFLEAVRATPGLAGVPAIMVTTGSPAREAARGFAAGANLFLTKPVRPEALARFARALGGLPA
jgi:two-component system chemotaxis response regulator CheY